MAPKRPSSPGPTSSAAAKSPANENRQRRGGAAAADGGDNHVDERGEFEDAWEDEFEEEDVEEGESDSEDEGDDGEEGGMSRREARETGMEGDVSGGALLPSNEHICWSRTAEPHRVPPSLLLLLLPAASQPWTSKKTKSRSESQVQSLTCPVWDRETSSERMRS